MPSIEIAANRGRTPMNDDELRSLASKAWHEFGILVLDPKKIVNWADRQHVENIASQMFGKRRPQQQGAR